MVAKEATTRARGGFDAGDGREHAPQTGRGRLRGRLGALAPFPCPAALRQPRSGVRRETCGRPTRGGRSLCAVWTPSRDHRVL